ncbi:MAG: RNA polymerase sigma factor [Planctomycetes bacterium]|nr:RNA polymerase sigma factor [Planctomycetota bacterium]
MPSGHDIEQLIAQAKAGDRQAAGALWQRHRRLVAAVLVAHGGGRELDDLLQEVALRVTRSLDDLEAAERLRPWLCTIARRVAIDHARRTAPGPSLVRAQDARGCDASEPVFDGAERQRWRDELEHALRLVDDLAPIYREPLLLRAVEGLAQREIAELLAVPETTVETRLARARRHLRERADAERRPTIERGSHERLRRTVD